MLLWRTYRASRRACHRPYDLWGVAGSPSLGSRSVPSVARGLRVSEIEPAPWFGRGGDRVPTQNAGLTCGDDERPSWGLTSALGCLKLVRACGEQDAGRRPIPRKDTPNSIMMDYVCREPKWMCRPVRTIVR